MMVDQRQGVAIKDLLDTFLSQEVVRETEFDGAGRIQPLYLLVRQREIQARQIVLKLGELARAENGNDDPPLLLPDPVDGYLRGRAA